MYFSKLKSKFLLMISFVISFLKVFVISQELTLEEIKLLDLKEKLAHAECSLATMASLKNAIFAYVNIYSIHWPELTLRYFYEIRLEVDIGNVKANIAKMKEELSGKMKKKKSGSHIHI